LFIIVGALPGCGSGGPDGSAADEIGSAAAPVVVTNCTGAAISAAIAAGGDIQLSCGSAPITINMPTTTNVTLATRVRPISTGRITFTHSMPLFEVNNAFFEIDNINLTAASVSGMGIHGITANVTLNGVNVTGYRTFAVSVHVNSRLTVIGSTFTSNGASNLGFGAPIYVEGGTADIRSSTFSGNQAGGSGGAITAFGTLTVADSTFYLNSAGQGGAIYVSSSVAPVITNSTFWRNSATSASAAIHSPLWPATIRNCTFADNGSPRGSLTLAPGGQIFNSILLDTVSPPSATCQLAGTGNVEWPPTMANCGPGFHYGDPRLDFLASNGGPTQTMALLPGSAAIDSAVGSCPTFDQRGVQRPRDGDGNGVPVCDVGAFER
jgi:predicted outer membrane repeat protein